MNATRKSTGVLNDPTPYQSRVSFSWRLVSTCRMVTRHLHAGKSADPKIFQIRQQYRDRAERYPGNIRLPSLLAIQQHLFAGLAADGPLVGHRFSVLLRRCTPRSLVLGLPRRIA